MPHAEPPESSTPAPNPDSGLPSVAPDLIEQEAGELIDNIVPTYGYHRIPTVGIGGSAGAIPALQAFFSTMPADSGMAFVVVLHLSPDHSSSLPQMLQSWTRMHVLSAEDGMKTEKDTVYVIQPAKQLTLADGYVKLADLDREQGRRITVDLFFRSLADSYGAHAAAIVLSGADGDGTLGIKRMKERGALTIVQDPDEAEHDSMPKTAIATGMIDWVLQVDQMPHRILQYFASEKQLDLPPEEGPQPDDTAQPARNEGEAALREVLIFLRTRTGRDFSYYKRATILRRISRRMQVNGVYGMGNYLAFLRTHPGEADALLKDMLISVTNFFRDRDAFAALEGRIPEIFKRKAPGSNIRVWVPACATGEEAYSLIILLLEHARKLENPPGIQVFGCDLDKDAIATARGGVYPHSISADVSEERLRTFFVKEHESFRVRHEVRELVLFAPHDLLKDAPFSRLDLISCRNLMIYLNRPAQNRAFEIFHFSLNPDGLLFLGSSETMEERSSLFRTLDKKYRIYDRKSTGRAGLPVPSGPSTLLVRQLEEQVAHEHKNSSQKKVVLPAARFPEVASLALQQGDRAEIAANESRISWSELHYKLLERIGPPSILVNREHEIQHISESAGRFLHIVGGQPTTDLLRLINPALRAEVRTALFRAIQTGVSTESLAIALELDGKPRTVNIRVSPVIDVNPECLLITFEVSSADNAERKKANPAQEEPIINGLEREIEKLKENLRDTVEQYEASTEELKASNEELQAMNEELRSATEELETSREELQSINEELTTVNHELKNKVEELAQANSDLQNLMGATAIPTLFLDRELKVMRFTNSAVPLFNLIESDVGRPLGHLQHQIDYAEIGRDAERVLNNLLPVEREVSGLKDRCYLARMLPYRTTDDRIGGVVLTFVDITERQRAERELAADLKDTNLLREVSEVLTIEADMGDLFDAMLDAAIALTRADAGTVQLLDPKTRELRLLATKGIPENFVERLSKLEADLDTPVARALASGQRSITEWDSSRAHSDRFNQLYHEIGLPAAQWTPLISRNGRSIGLLSTHWRERRRPAERELRFIDLLARQAADAIDRQQDAQALKEHIEELTRFNAVAVGRETRMIELKREVNELCARLGGGRRYTVDFDSDSSDTEDTNSR